MKRPTFRLPSAQQVNALRMVGTPDFYKLPAKTRYSLYSRGWVKAGALTEAGRRVLDATARWS